MATTDASFSLGELLRFYADAGVDEALLDEPEDRFAETPAAPSAAERGRNSPSPAEKTAGTSPSSPSREPTERRGPPIGAAAATPPPRRESGRPVAIPDGAQAARARDLAREARTLDELHEQLAAFDGCNLKFTAKNLVFSDGNPDADLMLVGEAPGRDEDLRGLPFVGRSGQLLDRMLRAIGRDRETAYIANTVPWRPPGNRAPTPLETEICRPFIERQIELARPKVLVALGSPSAKLLLGTSEGIMRLRGNWRVHTTASGTAIPIMPTLHPAYLLRNPAHKRLAWRDFLEVKVKLAQM